MSLGGNYDSHQEHYIDRLYAEAEMDRLAKAARAAAGHKSLLGRLRERVWPRRPQPGGSAEALRNLDDDPGS